MKIYCHFYNSPLFDPILSDFIPVHLLNPTSLISHLPTASFFCSGKRASLPVVQWPGREVDHTSPSSAEVNLLAPELFFLILAHSVYKM